LNAWWEPLEFTVPEPLRGLGWQIEVDTNGPSTAGRAVDPTTVVTLTGTLADAAARHATRELIPVSDP
jgi:hypothetical protein